MQKLINFSFEKMKDLLFPYDFNRWMKILFIVWLAGAMGSGGGIRGTENWNKLKEIRQQRATEATQTSAPVSQPQTPSAILPPSGGASSGTSVPPPSPQLQPIAPADTSSLTGAPVSPTPKKQAPLINKEQIMKWMPWIIAGFVFVFLPFMLLMAWLSARFQFILMDFMVHKQLAIRDSFKRHREIGNSLFKFHLVFSLLTLLSLGGLIGLFFFGVPGIIAGVVLAFVWLFAILAVSLIANDFVVPLMFHQNSKFKAAVAIFKAQKPEWGKIFLYYLVKLGLKIVAGIAAMILFFIVLLVIGIPVGILYALLVWMMSALPAMKMSVVILMIFAAVFAVVALILAQCLVTLPIHIYFQCFRLGFVTHLMPAFPFFETGEGSAASEISGH